MLKVIRIRLSKKDALIKNWWDYLSSNDINISQTISYTIQYYVKTGEYLQIGQIKVIDKEFEPTSRQIYIQENSASYDYLQKRVSSGEKLSTLIKRILKNSLKETTEETQVFDLDEVLNHIERLEKGHFQTRSNSEYVSSSNTIQNEVVLKEREESHSTEEPDKNKEEKLSSEAALKKLFQEEEEEFDLAASLLTYSLQL